MCIRDSSYMYRKIPGLFKWGYRYSEAHAAVFNKNSGVYKLLVSGTERIYPVSYTHLDVYKRQMLFLPKQTVNSIISNLTKQGFVFLEHVPGTRNRKVVRLTKEGQEYGQSRVMWIFRAEETAMEETDAQEVQAYISMLEKYISRLKDEIDKKS